MRSFTAPSPEGRGEEPERAAAAVAAGAPAGWLMLRSWAARLLMSRSALCTSWLISCRDATKCQHRMRPPPQMSSFPGVRPTCMSRLALGTSWLTSHRGAAKAEQQEAQSSCAPRPHMHATYRVICRAAFAPEVDVGLS